MSTRALGLSAILAGCLFASTADANVLYFQSNDNLSGNTLKAFIFGSAGATGTVSGAGGSFSQGFTLNADGFASVEIPVADELSANVTQDLGFKITSNSALSGYFLNRRSASTDMTYLIDGDKLGTQYVVAGYYSPSVGYPDEISVQATQDNTQVTISPKGGAPVNLTLNAGQTYMYTANSEQTGAMVSADHPVAVFSGNRCTNVPNGVYACDHIVEQMPAVDQLSSSFILAQTPRTGTAGNRVRVVAAQDGTEVTLDGVVVATLNAGEFYEFSQVGGSTLTTNHPVLVAEYLIGQDLANANTDPAMSIVPGTDQWLKSYVFSTPSGPDNFPADFVTLAIVSDALGSLLFNGAGVDTSLFSVIGGSGYSFGSLDVTTDGVFNITASDPFLLLASGADSYDSYFTYGGATFAPGASPPPDDNNPPPTTVPEPASLGLAGLGLAAMGLFRRRRRRR